MAGMNKDIIIVAGFFLVVGAGYFLLRGGDQGTNQPSLGVPAPGQESVTETIVGPTDDDESLSTQETQTGAKEISITSRNFSFSPKTLTLKEGQPVKITFQNRGTHTFTIDELGVNKSLTGSSSTVEFTPTRSGTYEFYCAVPGHRQQGMLGALTVE